MLILAGKHAESMKIYIYIKICTRCNRYGHKRIECESQIRCGKCGENHHYGDCSSEHKLCSNCKYSNQKYKTNYNIEHEENSDDCTIHRNKINWVREVINYSEKVTST